MHSCSWNNNLFSTEEWVEVAGVGLLTKTIKTSIIQTVFNKNKNEKENINYYNNVSTNWRVCTVHNTG